MKEAGLLFGSFNPIHIGHLVLANYLMEYHPFDEIWFVVSPQNPFKEKEGLAPADKRFEMVELATQAEPRFKACNIEFEMPVPSYTIHTLNKLSTSYSDHRFSLVIGSDNLLTFNRWHQAKEILEKYPMVVYPRPGYPEQEAEKGLLKKVKIIKAPLLDISSTLIRKGLQENKNLRFLLPNEVYSFISSNQLYSI